MIDIEFAQYCYLRLLEIYYDEKQDERKKLLSSFSVLKEFIIKLDEDDNQLFTGFFQRLSFIIKKYEIKSNIAKKLHSVRFFAGQLKTDLSLTLTPYELDLRLCDIFIIIGSISQAPYPLNVPFMRDDIINENRNKFYEKSKIKSDNISYLRVLSQNCHIDESNPERQIIEAKNEQFDDIQIVISQPWTAHVNMYSAGTIISFVNLGYDGKSYYTNQNTLLTLEPDYLIDVTDIAECFGANDFNPNIYFISKLFKNTVGEAAVVGNIVNYIFDELMFNPEVDFDSAFERALKAKPLQIINLLNNKSNFQSIREKVASHYHKMKFLISKLYAGRKSVEPSFIATKFGMQGRLDLLIEDKNQKYVVELKSGRAPTSNLFYSDIEGKKYGLSIWKNHTVQAVCYIMLMESVFEKSSVVSSILYSGAEANPLRNVPNILNMKKEILKCRNYIVSVEKALARNKFLIFEHFNFKKFGSHTPYQQHTIQDFSINYEKLTKLEKDYFHSFIGFINRERFSQKVGNFERSRGFASLWLDSPEEKESSYSIMKNLRLMPEESDFDKMHLTFEIRNRSAISTFRKGDICIAYKIPQNGKFEVVSDRLLKGSIREISSSRVKVSLRNKLNEMEFDATCEWALEQDSLDTLNKFFYSSIYSLIRLSKSKRYKLLGTEPPQTREIQEVFYPELNEEQHSLLYKSLRSKDYFLLQGPPGTGKTSFMLRFMVKYLFEQTQENILLLAYTNRAADEICSSLKRIDEDFPFLRLGGKESTEYSGNLIANIAEDEDIYSLNDKIKNCRVFVSTVASALTSQDIFAIKNFDTAIIDEASQINEYYLHLILTQVERFILIGDEKQLPAVITQSKSFLNTNSEELSDIELGDLSISYFERLLRNAKRRNWYDCYGMLTRQARMNSSIMSLANHLFYSNNLQMKEFISEEAFTPICDNFDIINRNDIIFIDTPSESLSKVNRGEASLASDIAKELAKSYGEDFNSSKIGIIAPFRAQVAEIFDNLGEGLQDKINVDTVERFQGSEREVIIISFAINERYDLSNIANECRIDGELIDRKLNVAITRAKKKLIMLGNAEILRLSPVYNKLIDFVKDRQNNSIFISHSNME